MAAETKIRHRLSAAVRRYGVTDVDPYTASAAFLTALVLLVVPATAVLTDLSPRLLFLGTVSVYLLGLVSAGVVFEGLAAALFATAAFNVTVHVHHVRQVSELRVLVVDLLLVVVLARLLAARGWNPADAVGRARGPPLVVGTFAAFAAWTTVSTVARTGSPDPAHVRYAVDQFRYLGLLTASALVVGETDPRRVVYPLLLGLGGTLVFAVDEVFAGRAGYLSRLGVPGRVIGQSWPSPSLASLPLESIVVYGGSPVGHSRLAVGMALVFLPLLLATATRSRKHGALAVGSLLGVATVLASSSHAGLMGLYVVGGVFLTYWSYLALGRYGMDRLQGLVAPLSALAGAVALCLVLAAVAAGRSEILLLRTNTLDVRLEQYATALDVAARHPLFGIGGGKHVAPVVHNVFLANLVATGVVGFAAHLTSVATATWLGVRRLSGCAPDERWLWVGVLGGMVTFYVYAFWTVAHLWLALNATYWILVGVVVGSSDEGDPPDRPPDTPRTT